MTFPPLSQSPNNSDGNVSQVPYDVGHVAWITQLMLNNQIQCSDCLEVVRRPCEVLDWEDFKCDKCAVSHIPNWLHPANLRQNRDNEGNGDNEDNEEPIEQPPRLMRQWAERT